MKHLSPRLYIMSDIRDKWAVGSTYEDFMGRWSRMLAPRFVSWLQIPSGAHWLDVGCGTGALTHAICRGADPASVVGCDPAGPLVEYARSRSDDTRSSFSIAGSGTLPVRPGGYNSVTSLLALNFFPDIPAGIREMSKLTSSGGTVSACVWDYGGRMDFLRLFWDAVTKFDPAAADLDEGVRFPICRSDALVDVFRKNGLADVRCEPVDIVTEFNGFDDYWQPFLGGTGPAPSYIASLDEARRDTLARKLDVLLPRSPKGTIVLTARAWAVRGRAGSE